MLQSMNFEQEMYGSAKEREFLKQYQQEKQKENEEREKTLSETDREIETQERERIIKAYLVSGAAGMSGERGEGVKASDMYMKDIKVESERDRIEKHALDLEREERKTIKQREYMREGEQNWRENYMELNGIKLMSSNRAQKFQQLLRNPYLREKKFDIKTNTANKTANIDETEIESISAERQRANALYNPSIVRTAQNVHVENLSEG
jgi:hypothetical protein